MGVTKRPKAKSAKKKPPTLGGQLLAAMDELHTADVADAAIAGAAPAGAAFTVTRVPALRPADVSALRADLGLSQARFAAFLNSSIQTVQAWEQGRNPVTGAALRLLTAMRDDPGYWKKMLAAG